MDRTDIPFDGGGFDADNDASASAGVLAYDPPLIDPSSLALSNRLSLRRPPVAVALGDAAVAFTPVGLGSIDALVPIAERIVFWLRIDGRPLVLQMARSLYERILLRIDPELLAADIDREILPLLLESCIEDGLQALEAGLESRVELIAVEAGAAFDLDGLDVRLEMSIDGKKAGLAAFRAGREDVERLARLFAGRPKGPRSYGDLAVELRFRAGAIWLDLGALQRLKIGDVLLVEDDASRWDRLAATVGEGWLFPVELARTGPTVKARFKRADFNDQEEWMMVEANHADGDDETLSGLDDGMPKGRGDRTGDGAPKPGGDAAADHDGERTAGETGIGAGPAAPPADAAFDDLPIKLVFELGRTELPLGQLQEIGTGHVFQLDRPLGEAVEIHAGGRRIGQGEVVKIDDQIGVRVVRLFGQRGA